MMNQMSNKPKNFNGSNRDPSNQPEMEIKDPNKLEENIPSNFNSIHSEMKTMVRERRHSRGDGCPKVSSPSFISRLFKCKFQFIAPSILHYQLPYHFTLSKGESWVKILWRHSFHCSKLIESQVIRNPLHNF